MSRLQTIDDAGRRVGESAVGSFFAQVQGEFWQMLHVDKVLAATWISGIEESEQQHAPHAAAVAEAARPQCPGLFPAQTDIRFYQSFS